MDPSELRLTLPTFTPGDFLDPDMAKLPLLTPEELVGLTFLQHQDGQIIRAQVVRKSMMRTLKIINESSYLRRKATEIKMR